MASTPSQHAFWDRCVIWSEDARQLEKEWWLKVRTNSGSGWRKDRTSRRVIDLAIGILMGLRGCSEKDAFNELVNAVHETGVGLSGMAGALVDLVGDTDESYPYRAEAIHVWGHLVAPRLTHVVT